MWKYRSAVIFIAALAFAAKTALHGDLASLAAMIVFLACHYADRFGSGERVEVKIADRAKAHEDAIAVKMKGYEDEIKALKNDISRIGLTMGIRGNNK